MIFFLQCTGIIIGVFVAHTIVTHIKKHKQLKNKIKDYIRFKDSFNLEDICRISGAKVNCPIKKILEGLIINGEVEILQHTSSTNNFLYKFKHPETS